MKSNQQSFETSKHSSQTPVGNTAQDEPNQVNPQQKTTGTGLIAIIQSVLAAAFGVQSQKNRERDFNGGKFSHFVVAGIIFTLIFIFVVYGAVQLALHQL